MTGLKFRVYRSLKNKVIFEQREVFVNKDQVNGSSSTEGVVSIVETKNGVFIRWRDKEAEDDEETSLSERITSSRVMRIIGADLEIAGRTVAKKTSSTSGYPVRENPVTFNNSENCDEAVSLESHYYIEFDIRDLKSYKIKDGQPSISFILNCGTTYAAMYFNEGFYKFIEKIKLFLLIKRSQKDESLYLVQEQNEQALTISLEELSLFNDPQDTFSVSFNIEEHLKMCSHLKFIKDPYTTTLGGFSKVSNFLFSQLNPADDDNDYVISREIARKIQEDIILPSRSVPGVAVCNQIEPDYEMVMSKNDLPERKPVQRMLPLTAEEWNSFKDPQGRIIDVNAAKERIFKGGIEDDLRYDVWKYLLGYYNWTSTDAEIARIRSSKVEYYANMKIQWNTMTEDQENRNFAFRERKHLIDKDSIRTDRTFEFYKDEANIKIINDILMTYCMYNWDLGYVQGMSDLLSPILFVMKNEIDAFWCFVGFMEIMMTNFDEDQAGIKEQLLQLNSLVQLIDPLLYDHLESNQSGNMYFCFRWTLVWFKREFSFSETMRLWEVLWTGLPCKNFNLLISLALLDRESATIRENNFGITQILKHINDMSGCIDIESTMSTAEAIYNQMVEYKRLPVSVADIIGEEREISNDSDDEFKDAEDDANTEDGNIVEGEEILENSKFIDMVIDNPDLML